MLLTAPFTTRIRDPHLWAGWVDDLGGEAVRLVWVGCDAGTLHRRLVARRRGQDAGKLADFDAFVDRMRPDEPPPVPHLAVDNRDDGVPALTARLRAELALPRP